MREIKFRAWNEDKKQMTNLESMYVSEALYYYEKGTHKLMQYTGLKDKNGVDIYEGDIVKFNTKGGNEIIYYVRWKGKGFKPTRMSEANQDEMEVIGNIYQNPDLMK